MESALGLEVAQALVPSLPIETLAQAVAGPSTLDFICTPDFGPLFTCPLCKPEGHNRACATVVDDLRWRCDRCRSTGTRWHLERLVVEDPATLERLAEILAAEETA